MHVILIAGISFAFRFLVQKTNPQARFYSWLIFPFAYSQIFYLGFLNFYLGIILSLLSTGVWLHALKKSFPVFSVVALFCLITLLYFTHLIPFLLFLFIAGSGIIFRLLYRDYTSAARQAGILALLLVPAVTCFFIYNATRTETWSTFNWQNPWKTLLQLVSLHSLGVHSLKEAPFCIILSAGMLLATTISVVFFVRRKKDLTEEESRRFFFWGFCWAFLLLLIFLVPDNFGGSGDMTARLSEFWWLFLLLFLAANPFREKQQCLLLRFAFQSR